MVHSSQAPQGNQAMDTTHVTLGGAAVMATEAAAGAGNTMPSMYAQQGMLKYLPRGLSTAKSQAASCLHAALAFL